MTVCSYSRIGAALAVVTFRYSACPPLPVWSMLFQKVYLPAVAVTVFTEVVYAWFLMTVRVVFVSKVSVHGVVAVQVPAVVPVAPATLPATIRAEAAAVARFSSVSRAGMRYPISVPSPGRGLFG